MLAITCFLLLTASCAHAAQQICAPDQFEGLIVTKEGVSRNYTASLVMEYDQISYDATNSRQAVKINNIVDGVSRRSLNLIRPVGQNLMAFHLDLENNTCSSMKLQKFPKYCLPSNAHSFGEGYIGKSGGLKLYFYTAIVNGNAVEMSLSKDGDDYFPVGATTYGKHGADGFLSTTGYLNLTKGINDPSVFDVPAACKTAKTMQKRSFPIFG